MIYTTFYVQMKNILHKREKIKSVYVVNTLGLFLIQLKFSLWVLGITR